MDTLIGDLLDYSRLSLDSLEISPVDLSEVVDDACRYLGETICARDGKLEVDRDLGSVMGHRSTLMQVMSNLVSNAIKFVPDGEQPRVRICSEQNEGRVRVFVEDNGIGIAPDQQARIFRVFERLHSRRDYPGTGIGLAIVKRAAVRLQGSAGVESRQGAGSRFWVELPAAS